MTFRLMLNMVAFDLGMDKPSPIHCRVLTKIDAEKCKMLKLRDGLYLLFWTETIMSVESLVVIDLEYMRSTGRFYCWDPKPREAVHVRFGSHATVVAVTSPMQTLRQVSQKCSV